VLDVDDESREVVVEDALAEAGARRVFAIS
jgi:hypothetical protein